LADWSQKRRAFVASLQFPVNLVRGSEKTALKQFRYDALVDAPDAS
jgi:hypothetical protein